MALKLGGNGYKNIINIIVDILVLTLEYIVVFINSISPNFDNSTLDT